jgi:cytochrome c oxidase subunit II
MAGVAEWMWDMIGSDNFILWIVAATFAAICLVILVLLVPAMLRRDAGAPVSRAAPRQTLDEVLWMMAPVIVFAILAVPSLRLLYFQNATPAADLTVRVTGEMWSWTFEYPDNGNFSFDSPMLSNAKAEQARDLNVPSADNHIVVPVGKTVRIVAVATNLIYSFNVPSLGARVEGLPGRTDESSFKAEREGRHYGQCSELCALPQHSFKPVEIEVVSQERFDQWAAEARGRFEPAFSR